MDISVGASPSSERCCVGLACTSRAESLSWFVGMRNAESQCVEDEDEEKGTRRRKRTTRKRTMMRKKATRRKAPTRRRARANARRWRARRMVRVLGRSRTCTCVCCLNDLIMRARGAAPAEIQTHQHARCVGSDAHNLLRSTVSLGLGLGC